MVDEAYFLDGAGNQQGPLPIDEIARLIRSGAIRRDTLFWTAGMPDWRPAGEVNELASLFAQTAPPRAPLRPQVTRPPVQAPHFSAAARERVARERTVVAARVYAVPTGGLVSQLEVWGLFWRAFVAVIGSFVVIPAPWTATTLYRYVVDNTSLPGGQRLIFAGRPGDIWYVLMGIALLGLIGQFDHLVLITLPLTYCLNYFAFRWLCDKVGSEDASVKLAFTGGFWGYVGWNLLVILSAVTIVGWAWALKYFMRWLCRNISGTVSFDFAASGLAILWRTAVAILASVLLIPIPWVLRWYMVWMFSQVHAEHLTSHFD